MSGIGLLACQAIAAKQISDRFAALVADEDRPMESRRLAVPYYQALAAITGAGKTPILAEAVNQISVMLPVKPLVLWIAKSRVVVDQTYVNFAAGGKYAHLLPHALVVPLAKLTSDQVRDASLPCIVLATVGTFNQRDKADGTLKVHKSAKDVSEESLWDTLIRRISTTEVRRPLIIVYDEGHNLSDQQTELLLELEPDAILVASATMKTPGRLGRIIDRFKEAGRGDADLVTVVPTGPIVDNGLVKQQVVLGGYDSSMELVVDELLRGLMRAEQAAERLQAGFLPKAIYVCRTNISQDEGALDNPSKPFGERKAPPILIWRYLVEKKKVAPDKIAVYADLKLDRKNFPPPKDFILFSGGEDDYGAFSRGAFQHIIFNLGLQEGWDDPACCFAYIDKSMGSTIQIEQVIGRVLRQPGAQKYGDPDLNTATFFIRLDEKQSFHKVLDEVRRRLAKEVPEIRIDGYTHSRGKPTRRVLTPNERLTVAEVHRDAESAVDAMDQVVQGIVDYRKDQAGNTEGEGSKLLATVQVGGGDKADKVKILSVKHSNRVVARWLIRRKMQTLYPEAAEAVDWANGKFDARVDVTSVAARSLEDSAEKLVNTFVENCELVYEESNLYTVGDIYVNDERVERFANALHEGYSDLNKLELPFARALDTVGVRWARNPVNGGYSIPLLEQGEGQRFHPDFLVWVDQTVYLIDPKGGHLLARDAGRKLLDISDDRGKRRVQVRLISDGRWKDPLTKIYDAGYTVWGLKSGLVKPRHCPTAEAAARAAIGL